MCTNLIDASYIVVRKTHPRLEDQNLNIYSWYTTRQAEIKGKIETRKAGSRD